MAWKVPYEPSPSVFSSSQNFSSIGLGLQADGIIQLNYCLLKDHIFKRVCILSYEEAVLQHMNSI